jgi:hypothetical protein
MTDIELKATGTLANTLGSVLAKLPQTGLNL